jgi:hypothetical protein
MSGMGRMVIELVREAEAFELLRLRRSIKDARQRRSGMDVISIGIGMREGRLKAHPYRWSSLTSKPFSAPSILDVSYKDVIGADFFKMELARVFLIE